jgi:predicted ester cyclase
MEAAEDSRQIVRRLLEEPWKGNMDVIDEFVDANYVGYDPSNPEPLRGPQAVKGFVQQYLGAFSDARITVEDQIAEGDMVATRWTGRGTHDGELMGIGPTQKEATVSGITMSRLQNGKVIEEWTNWDTLGMLQQLGAVPEMARA